MRKFDMNEASFEEISRKAMLHGIESILGDTILPTMVQHLDLFRSGANPTDVHKRLSHIFGESVCHVFETRMVEHLHSEVGQDYEIDRCYDEDFLERNWHLAKRVFEITRGVQ